MIDLEEFKDRLKTFEEKVFGIAWGREVPDGELFHYTTSSGIRGILTSGTVWATDVTFMNDEKELSYGNRLVGELYLRRLGQEAGEKSKWLRRFKPSLFALRGNFNIYAFCLTESMHDADQWGSYADNARGYVLTFDLRGAAQDRILKVIYRREDQQAAVDQIMDSAFTFLDWAYSEKVIVGEEEEGKRLPEDVVVTIQKALAMVTLRLKDEAWEREREWRYIGVGKPDGHRKTKHNKIPYQTFRLEEFNLTGIWLGPHCRGSNTLRVLLESYSALRIQRSNLDSPKPRRRAKLQGLLKWIRSKVRIAMRILSLRCIRLRLRTLTRRFFNTFSGESLPQVECPCQEASFDGDNLLESFQNLRDRCSALQKILVLDWLAFQQTDASLEGNPATDRSILLLALERGHIHKITSPVHRYLMKSGETKDNLTEQYRQDLREQWLRQDTAVQRHQESRRFMGKLVELQCAEWMDEQGWAILDLAALGGKSDIEGLSQDCKEWAIEVKYVGVEDRDFEDILRSLEGVGTGRALSLPTTADFLLFKVYTAAKQLLQITQKEKCALVIIDDQTWSRFRFIFENKFIGWQDPRFSSHDPEWLDFLERQKQHYPEIEEEVAAVVKALSEIWILKLAYGFEYSREYVFALN
ncbi:DUF2971 domain-containing protein [Acidobacteria bacterium AH-259-L09]|nr:DUF2971 domain-containing protein [Acidobacteria bacterium AH-259-L09]